MKVVPLRSTLKKVLLLAAVGVFFLAKFVVDIITTTGGFEAAWLDVARQIFVIGGFAALYLLVESSWKREQGPVRKLGFALVLTLVVGAATLSLSLVNSDGFDVKSYTLIPLGFDAVVLSNLYGVVLGTLNIIILLILRDIIFSKRRKGTRRNFLIVLGLMLATVLSTVPLRPLETSVVSTILYALTIAAVLVNSFRLSWIVYLSKREKLISIAYGFALFVAFIVLYVFTVSPNFFIGQGVTFFSRQLVAFMSSVQMFAIIYFGMTFVSTLFHLPTAEAFDRKTTEVSSLHNLSRLVTQVFDFNELVDLVTKMTLEVCEAKSAWLEILPDGSTPSQRALVERADAAAGGPVTVALKNISQEETERIFGGDGSSLRELAATSRKPVVVDRVRGDRRLAHLVEGKTKIESMVVVPLVSHTKVIGILYATKDMEYGFDKDDVDLISAFADQATIAIENSRLIEKSLERERLMREMMLAQEMQRRLLPQELPALTEVSLEALSTPAFEVGGDYYDFAMLDEHHLGVLVGDVSGKGVSAAFYMAEMKGIFQSLGKIYRSPSEFLARAHDALIGTIDRRSFISLIYGVLDLRTGVMTVARAGHCPMLFVSDGTAEYIKPTGLGLGMGSSAFFSKTIAEQQIHLRCGDTVIFYTDGVTEAHPKDGPEFGYELLLDVARDAGHRSAVEVRDAIIMAVDSHMEHEAPEDDLTIVVLKWLGHQSPSTDRNHKGSTP
jgi:serine phosphatase RsbU (regulator of sigma subunit)